MQVSWIDPDEVLALLKQIEGPVSAPGTAAWETHTLPTGTPAPSLPVPPAPPPPVAAPVAPVAPAVAVAAPVAPATPAVPVAPALPVAEAEAEVAPIKDATDIAADELQRIRQRLRELRARAEQSGVLPAVTTPAAPAPRAPEIQYVQPPRPPVSPPPPILTQAPLPEMAPPRPKTSTSRVPIIPPTADLPVQMPAAVEAPPPPLPTALPLDPPTSKLEKPTFQPPDRGLADRLGALASWACVRLETNEVVLVDDFGDVLWGSPGHTALVLSGMMAWHSSQRSSATAAVGDSKRMDKELQGGQHLTIIPARTRYGTVSLAAIRSTRLDDEDVDALHRALIMAVEGPS